MSHVGEFATLKLRPFLNRDSTVQLFETETMVERVFKFVTC